MTNAIPCRSSGNKWTADEDERLRRAVLALVEQFPARSLAAVLTRIALKGPEWWMEQERKRS